MKNNFLDTSKKIHLVGIGGIGVSSLAQILAAQGKSISGSDQEASTITEHLEKSGMRIMIGHKAENINSADLVIHSLAIQKSNPELMKAGRKRISVLTYPQAVGELTRKFFTIAVCGTHGKSTITGLISKMLIENAFDPNVIIGTKLRELRNQNFRVGKSSLLVLEACEYERAFLEYSPRVIILHTLDPDHLDYYKNFKNYLKAFDEFASRLPQDGYFFANLDDDDVHEVLQALQRKKFPPYNLFTYSTNYPNSDFFLKENTVFSKNIAIGELAMNVPGLHNRTNALAAFAVGRTLGILPHSILKSINSYKGAFRRFEIKGKIGNAVVIDDYAHHPAEIQATLQGARELYPKGKICVVFQPHQYNRTKNLLKEFGASFGLADMVIIPDIYDVRDTDTDRKSVSPEKLVAEIKKHQPRVRFGNGLENTAEILKKEAKNYDLIITMGAGNIWTLAEKLVK